MNSLEALLTIDDSYVDNHILDKKYYDLYTRIQTSLKALEIIKEKKFNIVDYYYILDNIKKSYSPKGYTALMLYNLERPKNQQLTQEDFDIVKKELNNESDK